MKIFAIAAVAAVAGAASADTVDVKFLGTGAGANVTIGGTAGRTGAVFAGQLRHSIDGETVTTFCAEVAQLVTGSTKPYEFKALKDIPGLPNPPGSMGPARAQAVSVLFDVAGGEQFGSNNTKAAAFQVALWELVFDFSAGDSGSTSLGGGVFTASVNSGILTQVTDWLTAVHTNYSGGGFTSLKGLSSDDHQDQVVVVPLPAPVAMGLVGLVAVAGVRRLRMR